MQTLFWKKVSINSLNRRWSRGHKAWSQGQGHKNNPRPRTALPRTDPLEPKDRNARGQGQGPRTHAGVSVLKKKGLQNFFQAISKKEKVFKFFFFHAKKVFKNFFLAIYNWGKQKKVFANFPRDLMAFSNKISTVQKIVLSSSRGQGNFRGFVARPRTWPSRPRTSKCVLKDVLEAKDVLKDSTSGLNHFQSYSNLFSQIDHQPIITSSICIQHLLKIAPIPNATS